MKQYWRYGFWKWRMLRRYANTVRWRQALPPLFVFSVIVLALMSFFVPLAGVVLMGELFIYFSILLAIGIHLGLRDRKPYLLFGLPMAISVMHISWGSGFLWSILITRINKNG
jgi:hypothetical protein